MVARRKKETGEQGNGGQFATVQRTEPEVSVTSSSGTNDSFPAKDYWGLPPFRGHGGCLRCEREFIGVGAFVGVRGQVAAPGVAALGVVAGQPAEHLSTAGLLVGEACGV